MHNSIAVFSPEKLIPLRDSNPGLLSVSEEDAMSTAAVSVGEIGTSTF
jgi:hypothetical protein